jgi:hypothetical protein
MKETALSSSSVGCEAWRSTGQLVAAAREIGADIDVYSNAAAVLAGKAQVVAGSRHIKDMLASPGIAKFLGDQASSAKKRVTEYQDQKQAQSRADAAAKEKAAKQAQEKEEQEAQKEKTPSRKGPSQKVAGSNNPVGAPLPLPGWNAGMPPGYGVPHGYACQYQNSSKGGYDYECVAQDSSGRWGKW